MPKKKIAIPNPRPPAPQQGMVQVHPEVWKALWDVVDMARFVVRQPEGTNQQEILSSLADREKMLRRALMFFEGVDVSTEIRFRGAAAPRHPQVQHIEATDRMEFRRRFENRFEQGEDTLATFSELGMGPNAERK